MWEKIKSAFAVIFAFLYIAVLSVVLFMLRRGKTDGRGSGGTSESDTSVTDGINGCEERTENVEGRITNAEDGIGRCEEHLQRAEEIIRNAINRSREERKKSEDLTSRNKHD